MTWTSTINDPHSFINFLLPRKSYESNLYLVPRPFWVLFSRAQLLLFTLHFTVTIRILSPLATQWVLETSSWLTCFLENIMDNLLNYFLFSSSVCVYLLKECTPYFYMIEARTCTTSYRIFLTDFFCPYLSFAFLYLFVEFYFIEPQHLFLIHHYVQYCAYLFSMSISQAPCRFDTYKFVINAAISRFVLKEIFSLLFLLSYHELWCSELHWFELLV